MLLSVASSRLFRAFLLLGAAYAGAAKADILGISADSRFPTARFPYARTVDGCTSWRQPTRASGGFSGIDFNGACQAHDECFHTLGRTWGECNSRFLSDLRQACGRDLKRQRLEAGKVGEPDGQALHLCYDVADLYLARVQEPAAIRRYELAQRQETLYLSHVRSDIQRVFITALRRPATSGEEAKALLRLEEGVSLAEVKTALTSGQAGRKARLAAQQSEPSLPAIDEASLAGLVVEEEQ